MANLHSFTSQLTREQFNGGDMEDQHIVEARRSAVEAADSQQAAGYAKDQQSLGRALLVLFQASRTALRKAMADLQGENVISAALRSLVSYVEPIEAKASTSTSLPRIQEVYRPLLDKIMKRSDDRAKKTALALLDWLMMEYPHRHLFAHGISADLTPENDKKRKLAVLISMQHALHTWSKLGPNSKGSSTDFNSNADSNRSEQEDSDKASEAFGDPSILSKWVSLLAVIVHEDGAVALDGTISMTRLTVLALDMCIALSRVLADKTLQEIEAVEAARKPMIVIQDEIEGKGQEDPPSYRRYFESSISSISAALKDLKALNVRNNPLIITGLEDTLDIITQFHKTRGSGASRPSHSTVKSFYQSWMVLSSAICQRTSFTSSAAVTEHIRQCLQTQDIPPSTQLVASCLVLGFSNPSESVEQTLPTPEQLIAPLLGLTNAVLIHRSPAGKRAALSVQALLLSTMTERDFKSIEEQVASILDERSELTPSAVELLSKYTATFPRAMIPVLIKHLQPTKKSLLALSDLGSVMNTRNAVHVVEVLAEDDFFVAGQPKEVEDQMTNLEDAVVGLLQDKDIMVRMTASQIVAALDPTKIVNKFASELNSSANDVRSSAELVLLESMLLQRKDGSLGDGFVAFLSFIRGVFHSNVLPKEAISKVKSPSQLLCKTKAYTTATLDPASTQLLESLFRVLKKLGESIPSSLWPSFVDRLVDKTYGSPRDQVWIRIWNELAPSIVNSAEAILALSARMLDMMEQQGTLTEDMVKNAVEASDEAFDDLQLARVLPLLILKTIPVHGFAREFELLKSKETENRDSNPIPERMAQILKSRSENELEGRYTRALAPVLLQGMFPNSSELSASEPL